MLRHATAGQQSHGQCWTHRRCAGWQDPEGAANVIRMLDSFYFRNHLCITFQLLSINLYEVPLRAVILDTITSITSSSVFNLSAAHC